MTEGQVINIIRDAVITAVQMSAPFLIASMAIGIIISVFQAATQIHEQTLTFVPKIIAIALLLIFLGSWLIKIITGFTDRTFGSISSFI